MEVGVTALRKEVVDAMVKQIAEPSYKFKQAVTVVSTNAWKNTFFREDTTMSSGPAGNLFKGVPWGANIPQSDTTWQEVSTRIVAHKVETNIPWEQIISEEINVQARTIIRRTREIVKSVDDDIWSGLTENGSPSLIQTFNIGTRCWDESSAAIIDDILRASQLIGAANANYETNDLMCFVSPKDKRSIMTYLVGKGAQFPSIATGIAENGRIGTLAGVTLVESNSVTASWALVVKPKTCATYKQLVALTSDTTLDPLKSWRIRIAEEGVLELTDPLAIVAIRGTQRTA